MSSAAPGMYITFVLLAIYGRMGEADALMQFAGDSVRLVADALAKHLPVKPQTLYRGVMLDPAEPVRPDPRLTFLSWTEDKEVARWFADRDSSISTFVKLTRPHARGFVFELPAAGSRILWHHSWAKALGGAGKLAYFGHDAPLIGSEGVRQLHWSMTTQKEVIIEPCELPVPERFEDVPGAPLIELEQRLLPPWMTTSEGVRAGARAEQHPSPNRPV